MKHFYTIIMEHINRTPFGLAALLKAMGLFAVLFCMALPVTAQKGKGGPGGGNKDVILFTCAEDIGNGLYLANFGYTNPTNKSITVDQEDSYIYLSDNIEDSEFNGIQKIPGITSFEPGTHDNILSVVFADNGHAKWTVAFGGTYETKIRATLNSPVCEADSFIVPIIGPGNGKTVGFVSPELISLGAGTAGDIPSDIIYQINANEKVLIQIIPFDGQTQAVIDVLEGIFGLNYDPNPLNSDFIIDPAVIISEELAAIDVFFPIDKILPPTPPNPPLPALTDYFDIIKSAQALYTPFTSGKLEETGDAITQGDSTQTTSIVRESFRIVTPGGDSRPVDGTGVNIVLFSNSWDANPPEPGQPTNEAIDVGNGDLPGIEGIGNPNGYDTPVNVIKDYPYTFSPISDEGRAMGHIAHDIAPGASLAFRTGVLSPRDFELGIQNLGAAENTIGVDDLTFPGEPMFGISNIGKAIQAFTANDNYYFTSAGNFYDNAYQAIFQASDGNNIPDFVTDPDAVAHVFGTSDGSEDIYQRFSVKSGETYMIVMQWAENFASQDNALGAANDLDFWVVDHQERLLVGNNYYNDGEDEINDDARDPIEYITFRATADGEANFLITSANGNPGSLPFRYIIFVANRLQVLEHFDGASTIMGHQMTPEALAIGAVDFRKAESPEPQTFSSFAGTLPDGSSTEAVLASFDGVNTNVLTIGQNEVAGIPVDGDEFKNFFGTSASVVHVAAAFALMKSAVPSWYGTESVDMLQLFKDTATPAGNPDQVGAGVINAANAFNQIATQTGVITGFTTEFTSEEGGVISADTLVLSLNGAYFPEAPKVLYGDDEELEIISVDENEIVALVGPFTGNEPVTVFTNSTVPLGTDGGKSNAIYLLDEGILAINVIANDSIIEYGQDYEFGYTVEGLPEDVEIGVDLPNIVYTTAAVPPYPKVANYRVFPEFDLENATDEQLTALEGYLVNFISGSFTVTKKDLVIVPEPVVTTYGEAINLNLNYLYDPTGITNNTDFLATISQAHSTTFFEDNTLALINRFKAVVNTETFLDLLDGGSWMATENTINNRFKAVVNEMDLIDLDVQDLENYIENRFKAVVNRFKAVVNGEDLLTGEVFFENRFKAVVNNGDLGGAEDGNDYSPVFAVLHADDDSESGGSVSTFYSVNLITGLDVTPSPEFNYSYPGAMFAPIGANLNITYDSSTIMVNPATLTIETGDLIIDQGTTIDTSLINTIIQGYAYDETQEDVFPEGIPYIFENENGEAYTPGDTGIFFITITNAQNYVNEYDRIGVIYVNPTGNNLRKIRTYLDCVEEDFGGPNGLNYIAHYRYENPNDETIYIAEGPENQLTGPAALTAIGELPFIFLPGQGTFQIRFDGNTLKWELTSRDSTHKSSTTSNANANSGRCDSGITGAGSSFILYPNPVNGILYIDQNFSEVVTLDIFDIFGILYLNTTLDGRNSPITHEIDMTDYPQGMYFIRITTKDDVNVYTVVKD
ncbi:MAG: T9SS type A sorting domain-containing protein [Eudoraea sp.]|uniref:T9SS type A sorting domain-containing protein n=1 Tax=Eudoraea sp. TaxID=1979955 RepID=UPI003265B533